MVDDTPAPTFTETDPNPYQDESDALNTTLMEDRLAIIAPLIAQLKSDISAGLDPEFSDVDVDTLPQPLKHFVLSLSSLEQAQSELVRCGVAINNQWIPPATLS